MFPYIETDLPVTPAPGARQWGRTALPMSSPPGIGRAARLAAEAVRCGSGRHEIEGVALYLDRAPSEAEVARERAAGRRVAVAYTGQRLPDSLAAAGVDHGFLYPGLEAEAVLQRVARELYRSPAELPAVAPSATGHDEPRRSEAA